MSHKTDPAKSAEVSVTLPWASTGGSGPTRGVLLEVAGDLEVMMDNGSAYQVIPGLAAGIIHPLSVTNIRDTNTTATGISVFW